MLDREIDKSSGKPTWNRFLNMNLHWLTDKSIKSLTGEIIQVSRKPANSRWLHIHRISQVCERPTKGVGLGATGKGCDGCQPLKKTAGLESPRRTFLSPGSFQPVRDENSPREGRGGDSPRDHVASWYKSTTRFYRKIHSPLKGIIFYN